MSDEPTKPQQPAQPAPPPDPDAQPEAPAQANTTAEQTASTETGAATPPPPPPPAQPVTDQVAAARQPGGFGRFVRHRATQIVAAGIAGLLIGGGAVALIDGGNGPRDGRGFYSDRGPRGGFGPHWLPDNRFRDGQPRPPRQAPVPPNTPNTPRPTTPPPPTTSSTPG